jgi:energy-coupling factor transporter ATP-binding protein EcfA2
MKRQLNKIIFIGSAFDYAEINLDGHTCIVGSNGVGKSTLLRAITFFYNPTNNKNDLGIPKSGKTFLEYYFEGLAYLIYEIKTETGFFHVAFYKKNDLDLAYRFVDTAYYKELYIDDKGSILPIEEATHRIKAGNIFCSDELHEYRDYRNILYGNYATTKKENKLRQFYLLQGSEKSHQIRTVIKDIFLFSNTNVTKLVGAKFVKEFIANTVAEKYEDELGKKNDFVIDLKKLQTELEKFTKKFKDIQDFHKPKIQELKNLIQKRNQELKVLKQQQKELIFALGGAVNYANDQKEVLGKEIETLQQQNIIIIQAFEQEKTVFDAAMEELRNQVSEAKINFDKATKYQTAYESIDFQAKLTTVAQKQNLATQQREKTEQYNILKISFSEIEEKYRILANALQNSKAEFINQQNTKKIEINKIFNDEKLKLDNKQLIDKQAITNKYSEEKAICSEDISTVKQNIATTEGEHKLVEKTAFFVEELKKLDQEKRLLATQSSENKSKITLNKTQIDKLQTENNTFIEKTEGQIAREKEKTEKEIAVLQEQINQITEKLALQEDSLYGYLSANMPEWRENIGKVFNENILFRTDLNHTLIEKFSQDFYGLQIDLAKLLPLAKSLETYEIQKKELHAEILNKQNALLLFLETKNQEKHQKAVHLNKKKQEFIEANLLLENLISKATNRMEAIEVLEQEWQEKAIQEKKTKIAEIVHKQQTQKNELERLSIALKNIDKLIAEEINKQAEIYQQEIEKLIATKQQALQKLQAENTENETEFAAKEKELSHNKQQELAGINLDAQKITALAQEIKVLDEQLAAIQQIEQDTNFQKLMIEKRESIDKLPELENSYKQLQEQFAQQKTAFNNFETSYKTQKTGFEKAINTKNEAKKDFEKELNYYENNFKGTTEYFTYKLYLEALPLQKNENGILELIAHIQSKRSEIYDNNKKFNEDIRLFLLGFDDENSLGFKLEADKDEYYQKFADYLQEFEINGRIETTIQQTNKLCQQLINLIYERKESLLSKKNDVFKKVSEINKEINKSGFIEAGLIDFFEMKAAETDNIIIQKMEAIALYKEDLFSIINFTPNYTDKPNDTQNLINLLNSLHENIKTSKETELSLQDIFEITFSFKEGKNKVDKVIDLEAIGSNGTTTLIKTIIYIALLYSFSKSGGDKFIVHCILDEVGTISANNLKKLLEYAESRNIYLVNALPNSAKLHEMYHYTWNMYKNEQGEQKINLLIATKARL